MRGLQTEFTFTLPKGYVDDDGTLHRHGTMRLSTARDELEPLRDARISGAEDPFLTIIVLARVITRLGTLDRITPTVVEGLFAADVAFLQDVYGIINFGKVSDLAILQRSVLGQDQDEEQDVDEVLLTDGFDIPAEGAAAFAVTDRAELVLDDVAADLSPRRRAITEVGAQRR